MFINDYITKLLTNSWLLFIANDQYLLCVDIF